MEAAVIDLHRGFAKARSWAWSERFRLASIEDADGEHGNDLIIGNEAANVFSAGWGIDVVEGRGGMILIDGGPGPDRLYGGDGNDLLLEAANRVRLPLRRRWYR